MWQECVVDRHLHYVSHTERAGSVSGLRLATHPAWVMSLVHSLVVVRSESGRNDGVGEVGSKVENWMGLWVLAWPGTGWGVVS